MNNKPISLIALLTILTVTASRAHAWGWPSARLAQVAITAGDPIPASLASSPNMIQDKDFIYVLLGNHLYKVAKADMTLQGHIGLGASEALIAPKIAPGQIQLAHSGDSFNMSVMQGDVRDVLRNLFREGNISYTIAPEVQGTVTLSVKSVSFEVALQNILRQVDATYRIESGVYQVIRREEG